MTPSHLISKTTRTIEENLLECMAERARISKLSNTELVAECTHTHAADFLVVIEMMNRLDPNWADERKETYGH